MDWPQRPGVKGCDLLLGSLLPDIKTVSVLNLTTGEKFDHNINRWLFLNPGQQ